MARLPFHLIAIDRDGNARLQFAPPSIAAKAGIQQQILTPTRSSLVRFHGERRLCRGVGGVHLSIPQ
jgi:hypothetical protein